MSKSAKTNDILSKCHTTFVKLIEFTDDTARIAHQLCLALIVIPLTDQRRSKYILLRTVP